MKTGIATAAALGLCAVLAGADAAPARGDAVPDLSGFFVRVGDLWFDPIIDDKDGKPVERLEQKGPNADDIWAGDWNNPTLQPWAREIVKKNAESEIRLEQVHTADDSCWPSGVPQANNLLDEAQFLQLKDRVVILYQRDHQIRHIYLNVPHSRNVKPSWYGESVGHYEDGALVVDTVAQKPHKMSVVDPFGTPHTDKIHVVERFEPFSTPFGSGIEVTVRVEDFGAFTTPWKGTAEYRQSRGVEQLSEMVCAENNRSFEPGSTFGAIPQQDKPDF